MVKYDVNDSSFDHKHGVLINKLGIKDPEELQSREKDCLVNAYKKAAEKYSENHAFSEKDVCDIHKLFLGDLYEWAGEYRTVDLSSENIRFCHAAYINNHMKDFSIELEALTPFTEDLNKEQILGRLGKIHGELIIIHPFRDGNGRFTRLLCDLLLMQANYLPMAVSEFYNTVFLKRYHEAIQEVWRAVDYSKLISLFDPLVSR
ncbi:Fic/DOC family protein [Desulfatibacillum aliphaticivorans]|uniref:Fic/DOC family protein n=1 Tax=Desulfatibacillum aliphaticivorans TaxID=218208 RepID=UPI00040AB3D1|nr:Fic family protein [Desulfatibacillum aliphaticivorans]